MEQLGIRFGDAPIADNQHDRFCPFLDVLLSHVAVDIARDSKSGQIDKRNAVRKQLRFPPHIQRFNHGR